ncbi:hypothetical protein SAMN05216490_2494 [Mucilaginibacter mallensis]|uniref:Glycerophosphoryl diester phosphodiesterase membrane domain-containing protein n=1 Tax=Mucilaginibacter mallensis TaxID=652787 RepID=A0A1H1XMK1_MUCMA|nr:hypothetical protein [Mucilaginibacter mallensis]SDT10444.1 hypothetical protein SAMN05216490_2494 [Mucilaginibacter mallensis]
MYHEFSVVETLKTSWSVLKKNFAVVAIFSLIAFFIVFILGFVVYYVFTDSLLASIGITVLFVSVSFLFLSYIKLIFKLMDKEYYDFDFKEIIPRIKMLFSYLILLILVSALSVFLQHLIEGVNNEFTKNILGICIGIFFEFFFLFILPICTCFIVDDSSGPFESVNQSYYLIKGNFLKYFLLFVLVELLFFLASLTLIGVIFVIPFVNIILVVAYRKLVYSHLDVDDDFAETN